MRIYLIIMAILAVLSVIFAIPDLGMMLIFLTIGLALPFMFVATLLYYGACLFPAVALWKSDRNLGLALTVLLFGAAAWLPGFQAARGMKAIEASLPAVGSRGALHRDGPMKLCPQDKYGWGWPCGGHARCMTKRIVVNRPKLPCVSRNGWKRSVN